jgi:hypothetical protein
VVHGDIKPSNVVRMDDRSIRLIDFDMSIIIGKKDLVPHAERDRFLGSTAYAMPELHAWVAEHYPPLTSTTSTTGGGANANLKTESSGGVNRDGGSSTGAGAGAGEGEGEGADAIAMSVQPLVPVRTGANASSPFDSGMAVEQIDLWAFATTLYEMVSGTPLFENSYDRATPTAMAKLLDWKGVDANHLEQIEQLHGNRESAAIRDVLMWGLDADAAARPKSVADFSSHAFFDPRGGSLRVHFVIEQIKASLVRDDPNRLDLNIMVSYCWADTNFVLGRLVMELAPRVRELWVDRLGGDQGMGEFARKSMELGVEKADIVIAVVSPAYIKSQSCGFEMEMANKYGKTVIPILYGVAFNEWPPKYVGKSKMDNQFATAAGDVKIFVDCTDYDSFFEKFEKELVPRLTVPSARTSAGADGQVGIVSPPVPCAHGCGWSTFRPFPYCCTHCKGVDGPHAYDCAEKNTAMQATAAVEAGAAVGMVSPNSLSTASYFSRQSSGVFDSTVPDPILVTVPESRGMCGGCGNPVLTTHGRDRDARTGTYYHTGCSRVQANAATTAAMLAPTLSGTTPVRRSHSAGV